MYVNKNTHFLHPSYILFIEYQWQEFSKILYTRWEKTFVIVHIWMQKNIYMDAKRNIFKEFNFSVATSKNDLNYKKNSHKPTKSKRSHIRKKSISIMTNGDSRLHVTLYHNKKKFRSTTEFVFIINIQIVLYL